MAVYPAQLTAEEKALKKKYAKLIEKRKMVRKMQEKPPPSLKPSHSSTPKPSENLSPKDAMAAAKKLLEAGKLKLAKKTPVKKTGFKRVGETPSEAPPSKRPTGGIFAHKTETSELQQNKEERQKKVAAQLSYQKKLYSSFVPSSGASLERIPKKQEEEGQTTPTTPSGSLKERTVFVELVRPPSGQSISLSLSTDILTRALSRFGLVEKTELASSDRSGFVTFQKTANATIAIKEMNRGLIRGCEVSVRQAGDGNNFVELSEDAASNPWSVIAAGKSVQSSPSKNPTTHRTQAVYDEPGF